MPTPPPVNPDAKFPFDAPGRDLESLKHAIANKLMFTVGKDPKTARAVDWLHAAAFAVRDVWAAVDRGTFTGSYTASVAARSVALLVLTPA